MGVEPLLNRLRRALASPTDGGVTDADLLTRFLASRDEAAFELVVRRHERMVWDVCRRVVRDHHDAEDVFQAAFLILARKAGSVVGRGSVAAWLHRVAYRAALRARANAARRSCRERPRAGLTEAVADRARPATMEWRELRPALDEALARLPEVQRAAVVLCYLEGKTYAEAARELGCPKGTLSIRLTRARERLRRELIRLRVCLPAGALVAALCEREATAAQSAGRVGMVVKAAAAGAAIPPGVTHLMKGVMHTMTLAKLSTIVATLLVVGLLGLGAGGLLWQGTVNGHPPHGARAGGQSQALGGAGKEPKTPAELLKALVLEQRAAMRAFGKAYRSKKTIAEKNAYSNKNLPLPRFAARFLELAVKYPKDPVAEEALILAAQGGIGIGKDTPRNRALALLARNHIDSAKLGAVALMLSDAEQDDVNRDFMLSVLARSLHREVRGQACLALARSRARVADHTDLIRKDATERKLFETYLAPANLKRILDRDTDRLRREAESYYQIALDAYADAAMPKSYGPMTVGGRAKKALFVIRSLAVGQTAPEVVSTDLNGRKVRLSDCRGKVVVVDVWATWCAPCRAMIPHQRALVKRLQGKPFVLISISVDKDRDTVSKFLEKEPMPWVHWHNGPEGGIVEDWNIEGYPTVLVLDASGVIRSKGVRGRALDDAVDGLLKEAEASRAK